ncbi:hypothetical protein DVH24_027303 [Malus domestica]|uniref:DNA helicase n=1 Tax=Malus domestica TaxID=3750 RepID=A0A498IQA9_MALDO|nr:hypothetical protein DVH24_027303 [Malus domestica]
MPLFECPSRRCITNRTKGNLILQLRASKFLKFQEAKLQELAEDVPKGHIPRTMTVHFRGELARKVAPGDVVKLSWIFLPIPYTGFRAMRAGLVADTYLEAMSITHTKKKYEETTKARNIFSFKMQIRGDLHICLMGDPGVAKSQLLKYIINVASRGVYKTGKGSSGVDLTAAVQKDPKYNSFQVLADMGICAIDEFDKMDELDRTAIQEVMEQQTVSIAKAGITTSLMDELDRTAIHEVMEQQTVSIAKAGITTSLNARTPVLAAANPAWGRNDLRRTPAENINLQLAFLSRFDLLWLILDRADMDSDLEMARHVVYFHQNKESPALGFTPLEPSVIRAYISAVRRLSPSVPQELEDYC